MTNGSISDVPIPGGWSQRRVEVAGWAFDLLVPANPDEFINQLADVDEATLPRMRADPYWAQVWNAAMPLAAAVANCRWDDGSEVLELGCGIGLPGLVACRRGLRVTFSDYVDEAVALALENARRNGYADQASGMVIDWRDPPSRTFDRIIASDVLYEERLHRPLLKALETMLAAAGEAWVGDPGRSMAWDFVTLARRRHWEVIALDQEGRELSEPRQGQFQRLVLRRQSAACR